MGLGASPVEECVRFARGYGNEKSVPWTNSVPGAVRRVYEEGGQYHGFGKDLVGQDWELVL